MLIHLQKLDYGATYAYAPPTVKVICATSLIVSVVPVKTMRTEDCVEITFTDGDKWTCLGTVDEILSKIEE